MYRVSEHAASFHIPLHRAYARVLAEVLGAGGDVHAAACLSELEGLEGFVCALAEHPLRVQALCAHVNALMWVRNGYSALNQVCVGVCVCACACLC